jgi:hypothetical protein
VGERGDVNILSYQRRPTRRRSLQGRPIAAVIAVSAALVAGLVYSAYVLLRGLA